MALVSLSIRPIGGGAQTGPPDACFFSPIRGADNCNGGGGHCANANTVLEAIIRKPHYQYIVTAPLPSDPPAGFEKGAGLGGNEGRIG